MKLFSLEEALAGSPVCTRDGRTVTQLVKFDAVSPRPLIGVVDGTIYAWHANGVLANWDDWPENVKTIIQRDIEQEFERAAQNPDWKPLGRRCDKREWEKVRALWEKKP